MFSAIDLHLVGGTSQLAMFDDTGHRRVQISLWDLSFKGQPLRRSEELEASGVSTELIVGCFGIQLVILKCLKCSTVFPWNNRSGQFIIIHKPELRPLGDEVPY
jgi:hypothetical protein